ncbi:shikimate dehydrogenase [Phenylobacterium montanum]|uniref:Shikimate dehydrogenase (NADP(+)) n=1 Tax=Phenylobacterium montanum TaxID=2823693 RepID=A0A975ITE7_9CAUL|nr:shikimate dehydrogenase [Caulobacter sp. S6]QUD86655.1 shikimate dehydrogenase [Caulobacter sp. S6]
MSGISGATRLAAVVGRPVRHSLSPLIHNAWLAAAGIDGAYLALSPSEEGFPHLVEGLRGSSLAGINVTLPFKEAALAAADVASTRAQLAGAANLLLFAEDGSVQADNTDGQGLLGAFASQASGFDPAAAPVVILGAGGAARGAAAAFVLAGAPKVRLVNRTKGRAEAIAHALGEAVSAHAWSELPGLLDDAGALVNATSLGLEGQAPLEIELDPLPASAPVMDMVYRPLTTRLLEDAAGAGHPVVDGLEMLILQAAPSFEAFFGQAPPAGVDVRALALAALEQDA